MGLSTDSYAVSLGCPGEFTGAAVIGGDLIFFKTGGNENINCVCIYMGDNQMIYPSTSRDMVIIASNINANSYWVNAFQWARRVF